MKIGILGGAFNPPHLGHLLISSQVLDFADCQEVWLTPCFKHTFDKNMDSVKHRVFMTKMLTNSKIKYCDEEIKNKLSGQTIELMELLTKKYPQHQLYFIIGSDNLKNFKKWGDWQKLITTYDFLIFPRPQFGYNLSQWDLDKPEYKFHLLKHPLLIHSNISSTNIRKRLKQGLSINNLVDQKIYNYIIKHQLYK